MVAWLPMWRLPLRRLRMRLERLRRLRRLPVRRLPLRRLRMRLTTAPSEYAKRRKCSWLLGFDALASQLLLGRFDCPLLRDHRRAILARAWA
jgi:hypothetical protein